MSETEGNAGSVTVRRAVTGAGHGSGGAPGPAGGITIDELDAFVTRARSSVAGELLWVALVAIGPVLLVNAAFSVLTYERIAEIDFAAFVDNAKDWLEGRPYRLGRDPNAPHVIALFALFIPFPLRVGIIVWLCLSSAAALAAWLLVRRVVGFRLPLQVGLLAFSLFAAAPSTLDNVKNVNMAWPLGLAFTCSWALARSGRPAVAAGVLGALATAKPFFGLWLLYLVARRDIRSAAGFIVGATAVAASGVALAGLETWSIWLEQLAAVDYFEIRYNASIVGVLARVPESPVELWPLFILPVVIATIARLTLTEPDLDRDWLFLAVSMVLIGPLGWRYYYFVALGPLAGWLSKHRLDRGSGLVLVTWLLVPTFGSPNGWWFANLTVGSVAAYSTGVVWLLIGFSTRAQVPEGSRS